MASFASGDVSLTDFYAFVDLFEDRVRNMDALTLDARVLEPLAASLGGICIMSRAGEAGEIEEIRDYVRELFNELSDVNWRARVASGWWPYGADGA